MEEDPINIAPVQVEWNEAEVETVYSGCAFARSQRATATPHARVLARAQTVYYSALKKEDERFNASLLHPSVCTDKHFGIKLVVHNDEDIYWGAVVRAPPAGLLPSSLSQPPLAARPGGRRRAVHLARACILSHLHLVEPLVVVEAAVDAPRHRGRRDPARPGRRGVVLPRRRGARVDPLGRAGPDVAAQLVAAGVALGLCDQRPRDACSLDRRTGTGVVGGLWVVDRAARGSGPRTWHAHRGVLTIWRAHLDEDMGCLGSVWWAPCSWPSPSAGVRARCGAVCGPCPLATDSIRALEGFRPDEPVGQAEEVAKLEHHRSDNCVL